MLYFGRTDKPAALRISKIKVSRCSSLKLLIIEEKVGQIIASEIEQRFAASIAV